ncbi:MAG: 4Fe-4S dicluster domain-containing protein, partial [Chloroflexota bacterium]|nr:4Fe-4S dicluster domain-containing protein [Chloroflexota bacterium]
APGPLKYMRVFQWEEGAFPNLRLGLLAVNCYHCEQPACVTACSNGAIFKEDAYGAVLIDQDRCLGERDCWEACPYGAIVYASDDPSEKARKCTMCVDRLEEGLTPICVLSCSLRALDFGTIDDLRQKYGELDTLDGLPAGDVTRPNVVFKPRDGKKQLVPWDPAKALSLWQQRGPHAPADLPLVFDSEQSVTNPGEGLVARDRLVLKPRGAEALMAATRDDE